MSGSSKSQFNEHDMSDATHAKGLEGLPLDSDGFKPLCDYISVLIDKKENDKSYQLLSLLISLIGNLQQDERERKQYLSKAFDLMAAFHSRKGEVSAAAEWHRKGLLFFPDSNALLLGYGECLIQLNDFFLSEQLLHQIKGPNKATGDQEIELGTCTFRKETALGNLYQSMGRIDQAQHFYDSALDFNMNWMPAHIGLAETQVIKGNTQEAEKYLTAVSHRLGDHPVIKLAMAHVAIISANLYAAEDLLMQTRGELLGTDRFEYVLFLFDFFGGNEESLRQTPNMIQGETIESEAARVWLNAFQGSAYQNDPSRIPEKVWRSEYEALNTAWDGVLAKHN